MLEQILSILSTTVVFFLIIGVLVLIHEFGHYIVARFFDTKVEEFAFGLGPKIWGYKRGETEYKINLFPIGGYVKILGENDFEKGDDPRSLKNKKPIQRIAVMIAGIVMNLLLASLLYYIVLANSSFKYYLPYEYASFDPVGGKVKIEKISEKISYSSLVDNMPAKLAGLPNKGDISKINGIDISISTDVPSILSQFKEKNVEITVCSPDCQNYSVKVNDQGKIGISLTPNYLVALSYEDNKITSGFAHGVNVLRLSYTMMSEMFHRAKQTGDYSQAVNTVSGPVGIFLAIDYVKQYGFISLLGLAADLSLVLGVMNLLPIPALDGGRIVLTLPELFTGKNINPKLEIIIINISFIILLILTFVVFVKDIVFIDALRSLFK